MGVEITISLKTVKKYQKITRNRIYNENCLDTMSLIPDNFIDLVVTSPPYDNMRKYNGNDFDEFEEMGATTSSFASIVA